MHQEQTTEPPTSERVDGHDGDPLFSSLPVELLQLLLEFLEPEEVLALCAASRTYAAAMPDGRFSGGLRKRTAIQKQQRDLERLRGQQARVRAKVANEFGSSFEELWAACQRQAELGALLMPLLGDVKEFLDRNQ